MKNSAELSEHLQVHALSHDGRGIGTLNGKTTFIEGALPNEKVGFQITQKHTNYNCAKLIDIVQASTDRATPACEHFGVCGGCSLQHMNSNLQLELKQQTLLDQLKHFGRVEAEEILPPLTALEVGYRRKARLGVKFVIKKNKLLVGFRERSSRYLADLTKCAVLHPKVGNHLRDLADLIASLSIYNQIAQIEVAIGDTEAALVFRHLADLPMGDLEKLLSFGKNSNFHIYLQPNPPAKLHKVWPQDNIERLTYTLPDFSLEFLFHPLDFTQINLEMNRLMVRQAVNLLDLQKNEKVLDLFCGIGNFSLAMARNSAHVIGIEGDQMMVDRASENALHNRMTNVAFEAANLMDPKYTAPWIKNSFDKVLLDPPRVGAKEILPTLAKIKAKKIVYVSCNPATLARDAGELVHNHGYILKKAGIMNMFPHTSHIEAMALFARR